jgi:hypothetical protein
MTEKRLSAVDLVWEKKRCIDDEEGADDDAAHRNAQAPKERRRSGLR